MADKDHKSKQVSSKQKVAELLRSFKDYITVDLAAETWGVKRDKARHLLSDLCKKGWLSRIKRGYYIPVDIASTSKNPPLEYPWAVATQLFGPCYIAGWSAAEYLDLTEQIFNTVLVFTTKPPRKKEYKINGTVYNLHSIQESMFFGTKTVWQGQTKTTVSDPSKTIIDMFYKPAYGCGIRQVAEFYKNYLESKHKDVDLLLKYAKQFNKGVVFKRLGFITEKFFPKEEAIIQGALDNLSTGYSKLDSGYPTKGKLVRKWNLWVPKSWLEDFNL